eukprot:m.1276766 g.1276766  ORF g.1276766 m.1276766 type:complete len:336 (+) comp24763_c0_seq6:3410-4417(+)
MSVSRAADNHHTLGERDGGRRDVPRWHRHIWCAGPQILDGIVHIDTIEVGTSLVVEFLSTNGIHLPAPHGSTDVIAALWQRGATEPACIGIVEIQRPHVVVIGEEAVRVGAIAQRAVGTAATIKQRGTYDASRSSSASGRESGQYLPRVTSNHVLVHIGPGVCIWPHVFPPRSGIPELQTSDKDDGVGAAKVRLAGMCESAAVGGEWDIRQTVPHLLHRVVRIRMLEHVFPLAVKPSKVVQDVINHHSLRLPCWCWYHSQRFRATKSYAGGGCENVRPLSGRRGRRGGGLCGGGSHGGACGGLFLLPTEPTLTATPSFTATPAVVCVSARGIVVP